MKNNKLYTNSYTPIDMRLSMMVKSVGDYMRYERGISKGIDALLGREMSQAERMKNAEILGELFNELADVVNDVIF